jgi:two-component system response regulator RstA
MAAENASVLIAEDDVRLGDLLAEYLRAQGFAVRLETHGTRALEAVLESPPDLLVLDLMLPGTPGLELLRAIRPKFRGGVLILTANKAQVDEVVGLELGADDYVTKPIEPRILLARVRSLLRRVNAAGLAASAPRERVTVGVLSLDRAARECFVGETGVELTAVEFELLWLLLDRAGEVVTREELYLKVLKVPYDGIDRGIDVHVSRVRKKLTDAGFDGSLIKSIRSAGYLAARG